MCECQSKHIYIYIRPLFHLTKPSAVDYTPWTWNHLPLSFKSIYTDKILVSATENQMGSRKGWTSNQIKGVLVIFTWLLENEFENV